MMLTTLFNLPMHKQRVLMYVFLGLLLLGLVVALIPSTDIGGVQINDKVQHATAFFLYALLFDLATTRDFWRFQFPFLMGYGALIEILQYFTPWRSFSLYDWAADATGLVLYWLLFRIILKAKQAPVSI